MTFFLTVGYWIPHTAFKSLLKYMYKVRLGATSELFWLPVKELVSVEEPVNVEDYASLRSGGEYKHPQMLLPPCFRCNLVSHSFAASHSAVF